MFIYFREKIEIEPFLGPKESLCILFEIKSKQIEANNQLFSPTSHFVFASALEQEEKKTWNKINKERKKVRRDGERRRAGEEKRRAAHEALRGVVVGALNALRRCYFVRMFRFASFAHLSIFRFTAIHTHTHSAPIICSPLVLRQPNMFAQAAEPIRISDAGECEWLAKPERVFVTRGFKCFSSLFVALAEKRLFLGALCRSTAR